MKIISHTVAETFSLAKQVAQRVVFSRRGKTQASVVCLSGELGAGKTTFTQGLLTALGVRQPVTSPTFVVAKKYPLSARTTFRQAIHLDCYRLKDSADLKALRWEEMCAQPDNLLIVEWPERVRDLLPADAWWFRFSYRSPHVRQIALGGSPKAEAPSSRPKSVRQKTSTRPRPVARLRKK